MSADHSLDRPNPSGRPASPSGHPPAARSGGASGLLDALEALRARSASRDDFAREAVPLVAKATNAIMATLLGFAHPGRLFELASLGFPSKGLELILGRSAPGRWIALRCLNDRRISVVDSAHQNPFVPQPLVAASPKYLKIASIPLLRGSEPLGVLVLVSGERSAFSDPALASLGGPLQCCAEALVTLPGAGAPGTDPPPAPATLPPTPPRMAAARSSEPPASAWARVDAPLPPAVLSLPDSERVAALEREVLALREDRKQLLALREQVERLRREHQDTRAEADRSRAQLTGLQATVAEARRRVQEHAEAAKVMVRERDALQRELEAARGAAGQLADATARLEAVHGAVATSEAARTALEQELVRTREELTHTAAACADLQNTLDQRTEALAVAEFKSLTLATQLADVQAEMDQRGPDDSDPGRTRREIETLRAENAALTRQLEESRTALTSKQREDETITRAWVSQMAAVETERQRLEESLSRVAAQHGEERQTLLGRVAELEAALQTIERRAATSVGETDVLAGELLFAFATEAAESIESCEQLLLRLEHGPDDRAIVDALFRQFHTLKGAAASVGLTDAANQFHEGESLLESIAARERSADVSAIDTLFRITGAVATLVTEAMAGLDPDAAVRAEPGSARASGATETALSPGSSARAPRAAWETPRDGPAEKKLVRVSAGRLEAVMNVLAELDVVRGRLHRDLQALTEWRERVAGDEGAAPAGVGSQWSRLDQALDALNVQAVEFAEVSARLQDQIDSLRLIPLDVVFKRLVRPVHDGARDAGRLVDLQIEGGDVQLERTVVDALYPPLLHIVRNAIAHGIEPPGVREAAGKPRIGTIRVSAALHHRFAEIALTEDGTFASDEQPTRAQYRVEIRIADDGAGLDFDAILDKARRAGVVDATATPSRDELAALIFRAGFTTQEEASALAGRGVGMNVVAAQLTALGGTVEVDSRDGEGTVTCLSIPVRAGQE